MEGIRLLFQREAVFPNGSKQTVNIIKRGDELFLNNLRVLGLPTKSSGSIIFFVSELGPCAVSNNSLNQAMLSHLLDNEEYTPQITRSIECNRCEGLGVIPNGLGGFRACPYCG